MYTDCEVLMGHTTKPLRILVHPSLCGPYAGWHELRDQGHTVDTFEAPSLLLPEYNLILGPNCWRMTLELKQYLDVAMKAARKEWKKR